VLLHPTSLPSRFGIGDLGPEALHFAEFLTLAGQSRWQMLPLNPTASSLGNSPYSSFSAFAGNTLCISPEGLSEDGLITRRELERYVMPVGRVDFPAVEKARAALLRQIFDRLMPVEGGGNLEDELAFATFRGDNATWLPDYALFMAVKESLGGAAWPAWPEAIRDRSEEALREYGAKLHREIVYHQFCQWLFFRQWGRLRWELAKLDIELVGDVPIYVTHDRIEAMSLSDRVIVMKQGLIRQIGSPSEIYEKPNSVFVAGFVGKVAFFPVTLETVEADGSCLCSLAGRKVKAGHKAEGVEAGSKAVIMARPESLRLLEPGQGLAEGTVSARVYLGSSVEVFVKTHYGEILVQVDDPSGKRIAGEGEAVSVGFNESLVRVLPEAAD